MSKLNSDRLVIFANTEISPEEELPGSLVIYTDGSYVEEELRAGIGIFFEEHDLRFACRLHGDQQCIDRAEVQAAVTALKIVAQLGFLLNPTQTNSTQQFESITIRTDSLNLIAFTCYLSKLSWEVSWEEIRTYCRTQFIHHLFGDIFQYEADFDELFEAMEALQPLPVNFQKIKAHSAHFGNDMSDALSRFGRKVVSFDNVQLLESLKLVTLNSKNRKPAACSSTPPNPRFKHFIELINVPMHLTDSAIQEALFSHGNSATGRIVASKDGDLKATRNVVACTTAPTFRQYMLKARAAQLDEHITCPVVPGILQCSRCLKLGEHRQSRCYTKRERCASCAQWGHSFRQCGRIQDVCANCKDLKLEAAHSVFSNACPLRRQLQERLVRDNCRLGRRGKEIDKYVF